MILRVGCVTCGNVMDGIYGVLCECDGDLLPLETAVDKLAFHLRMSGRHDEAVDVEDAHTVMQEWTA